MIITSCTPGNQCPLARDPIKTLDKLEFYDQERFDPVSVKSQKTNPWRGNPQWQNGGGYRE
jgi:hypothetical protein